MRVLENFGCADRTKVCVNAKSQILRGALELVEARMLGS